MINKCRNGFMMSLHPKPFQKSLISTRAALLDRAAYISTPLGVAIRGTYIVGSSDQGGVWPVNSSSRVVMMAKKSATRFHTTSLYVPTLFYPSVPVKGLSV